MPCCIICKKDSDTWERRSFHRFPAKNEELKRKWLKSLCLTSVKKTDRVCCDHFSPSSFLKTCRTHRRVLLNDGSVPELKNYHNARIPSIDDDDDDHPSLHINEPADESGSLMESPIDYDSSIVTDVKVIRETQSRQECFEAGAQMNPSKFPKYYHMETKCGFLSVNEQSLTSPEKWESLQEHMDVQQKLKRTRSEMHQSLKGQEAITNVNLISYLKNRDCGVGGSSNITEKVCYEEHFYSNRSPQGRCHVDSSSREEEEEESKPSLLEIEDFELPDVKEEEEEEMLSTDVLATVSSVKEEMSSEMNDDCEGEQVSESDCVSPFCFVGIKMEEPEAYESDAASSGKECSVEECSVGLNEECSVQLSDPTRVDIKVESEEDLDTSSRAASIGHSSDEFIRGIECRDFPILCIKQEKKKRGQEHNE